ncbi:immunoglobulin A1 protease autotransporter-like [Littorina saxatilis]|uniref:immunoglobulin A1 protease autotransporter-like n=1 Tax=Littorina saxatilis TaxID=31220 RepID=UPI0038B55E1C
MENDSAIFDTPGSNSENPYAPSDISVWNGSDVLTLLREVEVGLNQRPPEPLPSTLQVGGVLSNGLLACLFIVCLNQSSTASRLYGVFAVVSFVQSAVTIPLAMRSLPGVTHENWTETECKASRGVLIYFVNLYTFLIIMANWCRMRRALMPCSVHGAHLYVKGAYLAAIAAIISFPSVAVFGNRTKLLGPQAIEIECTISKEFASSMLPRIVVFFNCGIFIVMVVHLLMVQGCIERRRRQQMSRPSFDHLHSSRLKSLFSWLTPHAKTETVPTESIDTKENMEECFDWAQIAIVVDSPSALKREVLDMSWMADAQDDKDGSFSLRGSLADNKPTPSPGASDEEASSSTIANEPSLLSMSDAESGNKERHSTSGRDGIWVGKTFKQWRTARRQNASVMVMAWSSMVNLLVSASKPASQPTSASPKFLAVYEAARNLSKQKKISTIQTESQTSRHQTARQTSRHQTESQTSKHQKESQTSGHQTARQTSRHQTESQTSRHQTESQTSSHQTESQTSRHQTESQTSGHQKESQTSSHQKESQTSSHQTESQTSRHQKESQTSSHQKESQTSSHQTESQTSRHQTESQTSGHQKGVAATKGEASFSKNASAKKSKTDQKVKATKDNRKRKVQKVSSDVAGRAIQPKKTKKKVPVRVKKTGKSVNVPVMVKTTGESEYSEGRGGLMDETSSMYSLRMVKTSEQLPDTSSFYALKIGPSIRSRFSAMEIQVTQGLKNAADTILCLSLCFVALCLPYHLLALAEVFAFIPFYGYHNVQFVFKTMARYSVLAAPVAFMTLIFGVNKIIAKELASRGLFCFRLFYAGLCTRKPASPEFV